VVVLLVAAVAWAEQESAETHGKDYVRVPGGRLHHKNCVKPFPHSHIVDVANGEDGSITLTDADGATHTFPPCAPVPSYIHWFSWRAWTYYENTANITYLYGEWPVPAAPKKNVGQILYFWNGVEPTGPQVSGGVLQPVLQWGKGAAGGGAYWAVVSWYVSDSFSFYSPLVRVNTGDTIKGLTSLSSNDVWTVSATSKKTGKSAEITYPAQENQNFITAYQVLEAYNLGKSNCAIGYPVPEKIVFSNIKVEVDFKPVVPKWTTEEQTAQYRVCAETSEVISPSSVSITWN